MDRRKTKLPNKPLQSRLVMAFLTTAGVSMLVQAGVSAFTLSQLSFELPEDGAALRDGLPALLAGNLLITLAILVPSMLLVGILATFRFLGPLQRMQAHLLALANGEDPGECRLRKGDDLHEFCELLNRVATPIRPAPEPRVDRSAPAVPQRTEELVA